MHFLKRLSFPRWLLLVLIFIVFTLPIVTMANQQTTHEKKKLSQKKTVVVTATPTLTPTKTQAFTQTVKFTTTPSPVITTTITPTSEKLTITSFEPNFLWADYLNLGNHYAVVRGTGLTPYNTVQLVVTSLDEPFPSNMGQVYYVGNVTFVSSHEWWGSLPSGLYNSYYKVRVTSPTGEVAETGAMLVVSGSTKEEGTDPHPEYEEPTATPTIVPTP